MGPPDPTPGLAAACAELGRAIVEERARRGLDSQALLAERSGISARVIADLERGVARTYRRSTLVRLAQSLGWPLERIPHALFSRGGVSVAAPTDRERLSIDRHTGALLDPAGRELPAEIVDLIHFMRPDSGLDDEGREVAQKLLYGVVMTLAALAREKRKVRRLTGMPDPDVDLPDLPPDVEVPEQVAPFEPMESQPLRESVDRL